jgi:hypothetical protein
MLKEPVASLPAGLTRRVKALIPSRPRSQVVFTLPAWILHPVPWFIRGLRWGAVATAIVTACVTGLHVGSEVARDRQTIASMISKEVSFGFTELSEWPSHAEELLMWGAS